MVSPNGTAAAGRLLAHAWDAAPYVAASRPRRPGGGGGGLGTPVCFRPGAFVRRLAARGGPPPPEEGEEPGPYLFRALMSAAGVGIHRVRAPLLAPARASCPTRNPYVLTLARAPRPTRHPYPHP